MDTTRRAYLDSLTRRVRREDITTSQAVVLTYRYDHPGMSIEDAARACGVPVVCVAELSQ